MDKPVVDVKRTVPVTLGEEDSEDGYGAPGTCSPRSGNAAEHPKVDHAWDIVQGVLADARTLTLSPSVLMSGCCQWHGWLTAGVWKSV